jgi:hypothetical protein
LLRLSWSRQILRWMEHRVRKVAPLAVDHAVSSVTGRGTRPSGLARPVRIRALSPGVGTRRPSPHRAPNSWRGRCPAPAVDHQRRRRPAEPLQARAPPAHNRASSLGATEAGGVRSAGSPHCGRGANRSPVDRCPCRVHMRRGRELSRSRGDLYEKPWRSAPLQRTLRTSSRPPLPRQRRRSERTQARGSAPCKCPC